MVFDEAVGKARRRMEQAGLVLPDALVLDGAIHRVRVEGGKPGATDGMYKGFPDPPYNILWKNHKTGQEGKLVAGEKLTPAQSQAVKAQAEANKIKSDEDQARRWAEAAVRAQAILNRSIPLPEGDRGNTYLKAKGVKACPGLYALKYRQEAGNFTFCPGSLVMPIRDAAGKLTSLQLISSVLNTDGGRPKHLLAGGQTKGCGFLIGNETTSGRKISAPVFVHTVLVAEGLATAISLWQATGCPVLVALSAGNLLAAALAFQQAGRFKGWTWLFCADNDDKGEEKSNVGVEKATEAARAVGGLLAVPRWPEGGPVDFNDLHKKMGLAEVTRQVKEALQEAPQQQEDGDIMTDKAQEVTNFQSVTGEPYSDHKQGQSPDMPPAPPFPDEPPNGPFPAGQNTAVDDDVEIDRLAALSPLEYARQRKDAAKRLGVDVASLDRTIRDTKTYAAIANMESLPFVVTEPWPHPIEPSQLLSDISITMRRFIVCTPEVADAVALWSAMTWFMDVVQVAPLAIITAPEMRCGKTQLLTIIGRLSARAMQASNISPSSLFRSIDLWKPSLMIDEADAFMKENEELRGIINSGHSRESAYVIRAVGDDFTPTRFSTWGAKAIAGIGKLAGTLMDRAIVLELRRKRDGEEVERLRYAEPGLFDTLRAKLARFAEDSAEQVRMARPPLPEKLNDRAQDNWEPLLAIAMVAGEGWLQTATAAALKLSGTESATQSIGTELLIDIQEIFDEKGVDRISTSELIKALCEDDEKPWVTYNRGNPISPRQVSNKLKGYGVYSKNVRLSGLVQSKGFEKRQFEEAFSRYIPPGGGSLSVPTSQTSNDATFNGTAKQNASVPLRINPSQDVAAGRIEKYRDGSGTASFSDNSLKNRNCDVGTDRLPLEGKHNKEVEI